MIAVGCVGLWAAFSYAYLSVEDGSSGLSPLGWIHAVFFFPGGIALSSTKGSLSNADLPIMAGFSFFVYTVVALFVVKSVCFLQHRVYGGEAKQGSRR